MRLISCRRPNGLLYAAQLFLAVLGCADRSNPTLRDDRRLAPQDTATATPARSSIPATTPAADWQHSGRRAMMGVLQTIWRRGADDDTVLSTPISIAANDSLVFVYDVSAHSIVAFSHASASPQWTYGRTGSGPGEFPGVVVLTPSRDGVYAHDRTRQRISLISNEGVLISTLDLRPIGRQAYFACPVANRKFALTLRTSALTLEFVVVSDSAAIIGRHPLPWADAASMHMVAVQGHLDKIGADSCVFSMLYASRVAIIGEQGVLDTASLVERLPLMPPDTVVHDSYISVGPARGLPLASISSTRYGDYIVSAFGGRSGHKGRVLDFYDTSYRYMGSIAWRDRIKAIAGAHDRLFIVSEDSSGVPVLTAVALTGVRR